MDYTIQDISEKMGVPDFPERKEMLYYYHNEDNSKLGGYAEIRLEDQNRVLTASLYHNRGDHEDDNGIVHKEYEETMQLNACRIGNTDTFRVIHLTIDGADYSPSDEGMVELGLATLHSRVVDINLGMVEQTFNTLNNKRQVNDCSFEAYHMGVENSSNTKNRKILPFPSAKNKLMI